MWIFKKVKIRDKNNFGKHIQAYNGYSDARALLYSQIAAANQFDNAARNFDAPVHEIFKFTSDFLWTTTYLIFLQISISLTDTVLI